MKKNKLIEKAAKIAIIAHAEQTRKDKETPYIIHPFMVSFMLVKYGFSDTVIASALVHDVLEDTDFSEGQLRKELGDDVVNIVKMVSEDKSLSWEDRKKAYIERIGRSSEDVKAVSIADKIHNLQNMLDSYEEKGPEFWKNFNRGKEQQLWFANESLAMFKKTWQHPLVNEYEVLVENFNKL